MGYFCVLYVDIGLSYLKVLVASLWVISVYCMWISVSRILKCWLLHYGLFLCILCGYRSLVS